jgi:hypothetical protein
MKFFCMMVIGLAGAFKAVRTPSHEVELCWPASLSDVDVYARTLRLKPQGSGSVPGREIQREYGPA